MKKKRIIVGRILKVRAASAAPAPNAILAQVEAREAPSGLVPQAPSTSTPGPGSGVLPPSPQEAPANRTQPPPTVTREAESSSEAEGDTFDDGWSSEDERELDEQHLYDALPEDNAVVPKGIEPSATMSQEQFSSFIGVSASFSVGTFTAIKGSICKRTSTYLRYSATIEDFKHFCRLAQYEDGCVVTGPKLLRYLVQRVAKRPRKLSPSSLYTITSAVCALQEFQKIANLNNHPHARDAGVQAHLRFVSARAAERAKRRAARDPLAGTEVEGYNGPDDLLAMADELFFQGELDVEMQRLAILLSHFGVLRNSEMRRLEFSVTFILKYTEVAPIQPDTPVLTFLIRESKTNNTGRKEYASMLRNKQLRICPVSSLALTLFIRFHLKGEPLPQFHNPDGWYERKVVCDYQTPFKEYNTFKFGKVVTQIQQNVGIISDKKTHGFRQGGARHLKNMGMPTADVNKHGRWAQDVCSSLYLGPYVVDAVKAHAGFGQEKYSLRRCAIKPPAEILSLFFPQLEEHEHALYAYELLRKEEERTFELERRRRQRLEASANAILTPEERAARTRRDAAQRERLKPVKVSSRAFIKVLYKLREVLAQDLPLLMDMYRGRSPVRQHAAFAHPIFSSAEWLAWAEQVREFNSNVVPPQLVPVIREIVPEMAAMFDTILERIAQRDARSDLKDVMLREEQIKNQRLHEIMIRSAATFVNAVSSSPRTSSQTSRAPPLVAVVPGPSSVRRTVEHESESDSESSDESSDESSSESSDDNADRVGPSSQHQRTRRTPRTDIQVNNPARAARVMSPTPIYDLTAAGERILTMNKNISTVSDLVQEWHVGIGGRISVRKMKKKKKRPFKQPPAVRKFYSRRDRVVRLVEEMENGGLGTRESITKFFDRWLKEGRGRTLNKLCENLNSPSYPEMMKRKFIQHLKNASDMNSYESDGE